MSKFFSLLIGGVLLFAASACYQKAPVLDKESPRLSVRVSDSTYNGSNPYSYMLYESHGPREEAGFVTKDGSANIRAHGADVGGVKVITVRAQNGTLVPAPYIGVRQIETMQDGDTSVVSIYGDQLYAQTPVEHVVTVKPNGSNEVIVNVTVEDLGGFEGRSNVTSSPDIKVVFSNP